MELAHRWSSQMPRTATSEKSVNLAILWNVINIYQHSSYLANRLLGPFDLPLSQFVLLSTFMNNVNEGHKVTTLAHMLPQNQPTISKIVQKLLQKGYLASFPTTYDARSKVLKITQSGQEVYYKAAEILDQALDPVFKEWTEEETGDLIGKLQVMRSYLETRT